MRPSTSRPTTQRVPAIRIAFRTFRRALRHGYDNLFNLFMLSVLWYLGALLILPLGPVTAAVHRVVLPMAEERATSWRRFFDHLRADLRWSWLLTLALLGGLLVFGSNVRFYALSAPGTLRWLAIPFGTVVFLWLAIALFAFPLALRQREQRLGITLRNAALLVMANAPGVLVSMLLLGAILLLGLVLPPLFLIIPGVIALWGQENVRLLLVAAGTIAKDEFADREKPPAR